MPTIANFVRRAASRDSFVRRLRATSIPFHVAWTLRGGRGPSKLRLKSGLQISLRPREGISNNDYGVAYEIFVHEFYRIPPEIDKGSVRLVVDLGANIGFSTIYLLSKFPRASAIAVEPHPRQFASLRENLALNGLEVRTECHAVAAGTRADRMGLTDAGMGSTLIPASGTGIDVDVIDIFELLTGKAVDILKIDIEGGEYPILDDPRFEMLRPWAVVMEWHQRTGNSDDGEWCRNRLASLGYRIFPIFAEKSHGMLWAIRSPDANEAWA